jgi:hypothetical protein
LVKGSSSSEDSAPIAAAEILGGSFPFLAANGSSSESESTAFFVVF